MFTGIIKNLGKVKEIQKTDAGADIYIESEIAFKLSIDESVAINGTCLTVVDKKDTEFKVQAVHVTLEKTTIGELKIGTIVNLEPALRIGDSLGGHFVQGHVNTKAQIIHIKNQGGNFEFTFSIPKGYRKYFINEGSVALDGISLTIAQLQDEQFITSIIPYTYSHTNLHNKNVGDWVNLEVDMLARFMENFQKYS
jgi:riboflavin synthase